MKVSNFIIKLGCCDVVRNIKVYIYLRFLIFFIKVMFIGYIYWVFKYRNVVYINVILEMKKNNDLNKVIFWRENNIFICLLV